MSQSLLLCYGIIKDQLGRENRVFSAAHPFSCRVLPQFVRKEYLDRVLPVMARTDNSQLASQQQLHPVARQLVFELTSSIFLRLLEAATGFDNLLPDPYLTEGGFLQEHKPEPDSDFPCNKLQKVLRLDLILTDGAPLAHEDELLTLEPGACLLQTCEDGKATTAPEARALTLFYYRNPEENPS